MKRNDMIKDIHTQRSNFKVNEKCKVRAKRRVKEYKRPVKLELK